jgi:hypothetical protein
LYQKFKAEKASDFSLLSTHDHHQHHYYYYRYTVSVNGEIAPWTCSVMASSRALIIPMGALGAAMPMTKQSTLTQLEKPITTTNILHVALFLSSLCRRHRSIIIIIIVQAGVFFSQPLIVDGNIRNQGSRVFDQFS